MKIWKQAEHLDRSVPRHDPALVARWWADPAARTVWIDSRARLAWHDGRLRREVTVGPFDPASCWLLGTVGGHPVFAQRRESEETLGLRELPADLDAADVEIAMAAIALAQWHEREPFCGRCGHATRVVAGGFARHCEHCGTEHFPRHDPAMIVAVVDAADRLLLAHQSTWAPGRFSVLAGFCEAGESLEQTVRREVREEVGIELDQVRYLVSQPWPMPRSLMAAFVASAATTELRPDGKEITEARWMTREQLRREQAAGALSRPASLSVSAWLIDEWLSGGLPAA